MCFQRLLVGCDAAWGPESLLPTQKAPSLWFLPSHRVRKAFSNPRIPRPQHLSLLCMFRAVVWKCCQDGLPFPRAGARSRVRVQVRLWPRVAGTRRPHLSCRRVRPGPLSWTGRWLAPASRWSLSLGGGVCPPSGFSEPPGCAHSSVPQAPRAPGGSAAVTSGPSWSRSPEAWAPLCPRTTASLHLCVLQTSRAGWWGRSPCASARPGRRRRQQDQDQDSLGEVPPAAVHPLLPPAGRSGGR